MKDQVILMLILLMIIILFLIAFYLKIGYENGRITYLSFFREFDESELSIWGVNLLRDVSGLLSSGIMFFLILQSSALLPEFIKSSMVILLLTRIRNRFHLLSSYLLSELIVVFVLIVFLGLFITLLIFFKSDGLFTFYPIVFSFSLFLKFVSIFSLISILGLVSRNSIISASIGILAYFFFIPLVANVDSLFGNSLLAYLKYIFPPALSDAELYLKLLNGEVQSIFFTLVYVLLYFGISVELFERMEIT
jgi:hypothetical protein